MEYLHVGRTMHNEECHLVVLFVQLKLKLVIGCHIFFPSKTWSQATKEAELSWLICWSWYRLCSWYLMQSAWHLPTIAHCSWSEMILNYRMTMGSIPKTERSGWAIPNREIFSTWRKNSSRGRAFLVVRKKTNKPRYFDRFFLPTFFQLFVLKGKPHFRYWWHNVTAGSLKKKLKKKKKNSLIW
jgi:hypothetical protein